MRTQYIVQETNHKKREEFYDYILKNYDLKIHYPFKKEFFIKSYFPFVVDFEDKSFWICENVTCCAAAAACGSIINIEEFKKVRRC